MKHIALLSLLLTASFSFAAGTKNNKPVDTKKALSAATSKKDVTGTVKWTGYGVGKSHTGTLALKSGYLELKGEEIVGGEFIIDMSSLKAPDSEKLQGHLQSPDFFDVKKYPEAKFKITKVEKTKSASTGGPTHTLTGDLTIKDKTNAETFLATVNKDQWSAVAETEIKDRTKYNIVYNSAQFKTASALGDKLIEDKIKIELDLKAK